MTKAMALEKDKGGKPTPHPKILLLRYSDFQGNGTIKEHQTVIDTFGYCWFGKFGKKITPKYLSSLMENNTPCTVFLYTAGVLHKCQMDAVSYERPVSGYPDYYNTFLFQKEDFTPHVFLKLNSIEPLSLEALEQYVVVSSGRPIIYVLKKTICSYIIIQDKEDWVQPEKKKQVIKEKTLLPVKSIDPNSCVFRECGACTNRYSINYSYECERPAMCIKQKVK